MGHKHLLHLTHISWSFQRVKMLPTCLRSAILEEEEYWILLVLHWIKRKKRFWLAILCPSAQCMQRCCCRRPQLASLWRGNTTSTSAILQDEEYWILLVLHRIKPDKRFWLALPCPSAQCIQQFRHDTHGWPHNKGAIPYLHERNRIGWRVLNIISSATNETKRALLTDVTMSLCPAHAAIPL